MSHIHVLAPSPNVTHRSSADSLKSSLKTLNKLQEKAKTADFRRNKPALLTQQDNRFKESGRGFIPQNLLSMNYNKKRRANFGDVAK